MNGLSLSLAFLAGNLAVVNPCGFALLPAFLSFYVGTDDHRLPSAGSRLAQGLLVGLTVTVAFLAVFTVVGIPVAVGASALGRAIPWVTILIGLLLIAAGSAQLLGRHVTLPFTPALTAGRDRRLATFFVFGVAYAISSLGCTLPIFISVVGSSLATSGPIEALGVFAAYVAGTGTLIIALSISAALLRGGLARALKGLMPHFNRLAGIFLIVVGAYLILYWGSVLAAPAGLGSNPGLELGIRISSATQGWLVTPIGRWFALGASVLVLAAIAAVLLRRPPAQKAAVDASETAPTAL